MKLNHGMKELPLHPAKTYELRLDFVDVSGKRAAQIKEDVKAWLISHEVDAFVEGSLEGIDIDHEENFEGRDFYAELGGNNSPLSIYKYSVEALEDLRARLVSVSEFREGVTYTMHSMDTTVWLEGWKESFKPFSTERFYIYPPWETGAVPPGKMPLVIEPGMAFGTGQHATTQVCIRQLEKIEAKVGSAVRNLRMLDVGTGTGILAVAALKLGFGCVAGTDIDADAMIACKTNGELNGLKLNVFQMSVPGETTLEKAFAPPYDLVIANILIVVLERIIGDLARVVKPGGTLVLSGLLMEDAGHMIKLTRAEGLTLVDQADLGGWACLELTKPLAGA